MAPHSPRPIRFVVPGALTQRTGGYRYDERIVLGLRALGRRVTVSELDGAFPFADARACDAAATCLRDAAPDEALVIDGLALPAFAGSERALAGRTFVPLIHHPHARETGLGVEDARALDRLVRTERSLLSAARRVVVTSEATARDLAELGSSRAKTSVVLPGTDPAPLARGSCGSDNLVLLCVATLTPRKGHRVLLDALASLRHLAFRLVCVGSASRAPACASDVRARIGPLGLEGRVHFTGEVEEAALARHYDEADVFVLASLHEGYGMALAEALARGLPVVSTRAGAIPETVPEGAGLLVAPGEVAPLSVALAQVLEDHTLRARLRSGAVASRVHLPTWRESAQQFAAILEAA